MARDYVDLRPVRESPHLYEPIEDRIKAAFRRLLYAPILEDLEVSESALKNAADKGRKALLEAIASGRLSFSRGVFSGKFSAAITKELKSLGATWDRRSKAFKLRLSALPPDIQQAISVSEQRFQDRLKRADRRLGDMLPAEVAGSVKVSDLFSTAIYKVERELNQTLKSLAVPAVMTPEQRERIASEWQKNMDLWITNFTAEEIVRLRKQIRASVFAGNRHEAVIKALQRSYGVTVAKAKFLAHQETRLLMAKVKETQYAGAGVDEYTWRCVAGSKLHPVRPSHKALDGKVFRFDNPPITTAPGEPQRRNNPGEDYNCRCGAIPRVSFKREKTA